MNDRIFHPNKHDVFSAMQYNMGSCVKKMHMTILNRCLQNPCLLFTFSVSATFSFTFFLLRTEERQLAISFDTLHTPLCCSLRATKLSPVSRVFPFSLIIALMWMKTISGNLVIIEQIAYVNADNS